MMSRGKPVKPSACLGPAAVLDPDSLGVAAKVASERRSAGALALPEALLEPGIEHALLVDDRVVLVVLESERAQEVRIAHPLAHRRGAVERVAQVDAGHVAFAAHDPDVAGKVSARTPGAVEVEHLDL